jgi:hypothetical protein
MLNSGPNVFWYGERGIINAVVAHVSTSGDFVGSVRNVLTATCWGHANRPSWIEDVSDAHLIVEVGLADFGDPDLLIVCHTGSGMIHLVFLEAKAQSYTDSMQKTKPLRAAKWGMEQKGFNSSINGQLTLKYRFANALSLWDGRAAAISESRSLFEAYQGRLNDSPRKSPGRSLAKPSILTGIFGRLGLARLPEANCHYIALTWDCESKAFFNSPDVSSDYLPVFLGDAGEERFSTMLDRIGWIGYKQLEDALGLSNATEYKAAFTTMLDSPEPPMSFYAEKKRQGRWETYPSEIIKLGEDLAVALGTVHIQRLAGSYSMKDENAQTVGKIMPNKGSVFIGVREEHTPFCDARGWIDQARVRKKWVQRAEFIGIDVKSVSEAERLIRGIKSVLADLPEPAEGMPEETEVS